MSNWNKITLFKFQQIDEINARQDLSDIDKILFSACTVFDMTEHEMDNTEPKKALHLTKKVEKIFSSPFNPLPQKRIGRYFIKYDVSKITFGQYIELSFFLSAKPIQNAHYAIASISRGLTGKGDHPTKAEYFLKRPVAEITGSIALLMERFSAFNAEYKSLFGIPKELGGEETQEDKFNKRYGWIYSATQVADYERITMDKTFELPVRQAFNDLAFLKAKSIYEAEQLKRKN